MKAVLAAPHHANINSYGKWYVYIAFVKVDNVISEYGSAVLSYGLIFLVRIHGYGVR
jgi:hypothetical protein